MTKATTDDATAFVREHTEAVRTELVPEIELWLAREPFAIFQAAERLGADRPYWAFAWSGGQGVARHILDHPGLVAGKRVIDIGAGSAITAIAAAMAGAASVNANDTDINACAAAYLNAAANGVALEVTSDDLLGTSPDADLVVIGDLFYEPELVTRVSGLLERLARRGTPVLYGDHATARRPPVERELMSEHVAALTPHLEIGYVDQAMVWRIGAAQKVRRA